MGWTHGFWTFKKNGPAAKSSDLAPRRPRRCLGDDLTCLAAKALDLATGPNSSPRFVLPNTTGWLVDKLTTMFLSCAQMGCKLSNSAIWGVSWTQEVTSSSWNNMFSLKSPDGSPVWSLSGLKGNLICMFSYYMCQNKPFLVIELLLCFLSPFLQLSDLLAFQELQLQILLVSIPMEGSFKPVCLCSLHGMLSYIDSLQPPYMGLKKLQGTGKLFRLGHMIES